MEVLLELALENLLAPLTLFFLMGVLAGAVKSDLEIPDSISKALAIYLITAIGYKGGIALGDQDLSGVWPVLLFAAAFSFFLPFLSFVMLKFFSRLDALNRASVAAHYGSVSLVTFTAALTFIESYGMESSGIMIAVLAIMETPAIMSGLLLASVFGTSQAFSKRPGILMREVFLNGTVILLLGSFVIGYLASPDQQAAFQPFFISPFKGVLSLFLLEMGILVGRRIEEIRALGFMPFLFGIVMPLIGGGLGAYGSSFLGLTAADHILLTVLCASASYIAVPAAMRIALPRSDVSIPLTLSLAVTFPFNIIAGIPLYFWLVQGADIF